MKFKICFIVLLYIGTIHKSFCQETKTYSSEDGNFVYQYYEDSQMNRIYNGTYKEINQNITIKGHFKENQKNGTWLYLITQDLYTKNDFIFNREFFGNFKNNKKNGLWSYKSNYDKKTKIFNSISNLNFKNDTIVGDIDFTNLQVDNISGYKGKIDSLGNFTGIWQKKKIIQMKIL